jgi:DNA polymerase III delta prime subunit
LHALNQATKNFWKKKYKWNLGRLFTETLFRDDRGIDVVRNNIIKFAESSAIDFDTQRTDPNVFKLIILDEADAMTKDAQNALKRVIEKYARNVRFCLICNHLSNIIPAVQSRCTRFLAFKFIKKHVCLDSVSRLFPRIKSFRDSITLFAKKA